MRHLGDLSMYVCERAPERAHRHRARDAHAGSPRAAESEAAGASQLSHASRLAAHGSSRPTYCQRCAYFPLGKGSREKHPQVSFHDFLSTTRVKGKSGPTAGNRLRGATRVRDTEGDNGDLYNARGIDPSVDHQDFTPLLKSVRHPSVGKQGMKRLKFRT